MICLNNLADRKSTSKFNGPEVRYSVNDPESGYAVLLEKGNGRIFRAECGHEECGGLALRGVRV